MRNRIPLALVVLLGAGFVFPVGAADPAESAVPTKKVKPDSIQPVEIEPIRSVDVEPIRSVDVEPIQPGDIEPIQPGDIEPIQPLEVTRPGAEPEQAVPAEADPAAGAGSVIPAEPGAATDINTDKLKELEALEKELPPEPYAPPPRERQAPPPPPPTKAGSGPDFIAHGPASKKLGGSYNSRWLSKYFFRGLKFSSDDVWQQELGLWYQGFKIGGFSSFDFEPDKFNEARGTISYSHRLFDDTAIEAGYTYYGYPNNLVKDTQEIFGGIKQEWVVDGSLYGYYDFDEGSGFIGELGLGKHFRYDMIDPYVWTTTTLNGRYFNDDVEFSHMIVTAGLPVHLGDHVIVGASANYQWGWQGWVEDRWFFMADLTLRF